LSLILLWEPNLCFKSYFEGQVILIELQVPKKRNNYKMRDKFYCLLFVFLCKEKIGHKVAIKLTKQGNCIGVRDFSHFLFTIFQEIKAKKQDFTIPIKIYLQFCIFFVLPHFLANLHKQLLFSCLLLFLVFFGLLRVNTNEQHLKRAVFVGKIKNSQKDTKYTINKEIFFKMKKNSRNLKKQN
jgi:hypothetical protein